MSRTIITALGFLSFLFGSLHAQTLAPQVTDKATPFAVPAPDEASPFTLSKQVALNGDGTMLRTPVVSSQYPRNRNSPDTASALLGKLFRETFASVNIGPLRGEPTVPNLAVTPEKFALQDRREVNATYTILNNTSKITRIEYPTTQRIDILTYDSEGKVIERWSDDRVFTPEEGIVVINPKERIEYQEKVPTRDMKLGQSYRIEAKAMTDPAFVVERVVTPE